MHYYRNVELARIFGVSEGTVRRWVLTAEQGKSKLELFERNGRKFIANTSKNTHLMKSMVEKRRKYKNDRWHKVIEPTEEFYRLYDKRQILDIASNIKLHREILRDYGYFGKGAEAWSDYADKLWNEENDNILHATTELLEECYDHLDKYMAQYERVNVVDIGVGNALPVKGFLSHLLESGRLNRYIALDISEKMLEISRHNILKWFGDEVPYEGYARNVTSERFDDLLADEDEETTLTIALFFGGTLSNFRAPADVLKFIASSLSVNSILITTTKPDTDEARRFFDFNTESKGVEVPLQNRVLLDNLGIVSSLYDVIQGYDDKYRARYIKVQLKIDITLRLNIGSIKRDIHIKKGETLLLWRAWHRDRLEALHLLEDNNFSLLATCLTNNQQFMLSIAKIKGAPSFV